MKHVQGEFVYDRFLPSRTMRSGANPATPSGRACHMLFNNSTGAFALLLWNILAYPGGGNPVGAALTQTSAGTATGVTISPFISGGQIGPGQHLYGDGAFTAINPDLILGAVTGQTSWMVDKPVMALLPGWGCAVQVLTSGVALRLSFIWSYIDAAELYAYEIPGVEGHE